MLSINNYVASLIFPTNVYLIYTCILLLKEL